MESEFKVYLQRKARLWRFGDSVCGQKKRLIGGILRESIACDNQFRHFRVGRPEESLMNDF